mmetsp:Transcript_85806/g.135522  ORF Transcript_85806/g.135522 Transcript_85806/m.135522 type:complete len:85 (-) Transcript_85806:9-263(-)
MASLLKYLLLFAVASASNLRTIKTSEGSPCEDMCAKIGEKTTEGCQQHCGDDFTLTTGTSVLCLHMCSEFFEDKSLLQCKAECR